MVRFLIRAGLLVVAISVTSLIVADTEMGGAYRDFAKKALVAGAGLCATGALLWLIAKAANIAAGRRCPRCRRRVARGHIYCEDHFQEALSHARDRFRP